MPTQPRRVPNATAASAPTTPAASSFSWAPGVRTARWGGADRLLGNQRLRNGAGVDASNTPLGTVLLLPLDPDASAGPG